MIRIVVLDKSFISVGVYSRTIDGVQLTNANVIRRWGTERGLGQIAADGPTPATILDKTPTQEIPWHSVIKTIECDEANWRTALGLGDLGAPAKATKE